MLTILVSFIAGWYFMAAYRLLVQPFVQTFSIWQTCRRNAYLQSEEQRCNGRTSMLEWGWAEIVTPEMASGGCRRAGLTPAEADVPLLWAGKPWWKVRVLLPWGAVLNDGETATTNTLNRLTRGTTWKLRECAPMCAMCAVYCRADGWLWFVWAFRFVAMKIFLRQRALKYKFVVWCLRHGCYAHVDDKDAIFHIANPSWFRLIKGVRYPSKFRRERAAREWPKVPKYTADAQQSLR